MKRMPFNPVLFYLIILGTQKMIIISLWFLKKKSLFLPGCSLSRHVLCEDADNSGDNLIGDETTSDEVSPQNSAADIYTDLNETIPDSSNYESLLSVEPVLNRPTANETTTVNATSVKKFVCMIDNLEDETLPLSSFQVISISRTDFSKKIQNKSNIVLWLFRWSILQLFYHPWNKIQM